MKSFEVPDSVSTADRARAIAHDVLAGLVASILLIANIVSFAALMFPGALAHGATTAIWAMLIGSGLGGLWIAWKTSLPPLSSGIDSPTGAVFVVLAAGTASTVLAGGGSPESAVRASMLLFSAATALSGALLLALGIARWGSYLRFVPYFVVAGFLAATGWLLIAGGVRMTTGHGLGSLLSAWTPAQAAKLGCAVVVLAVLLALRRWVRSALATPVAILAMTLLLGLALRLLGLSDPGHGWTLPSLGALEPWSPWRALREPPIALSQALAFVPEMVAVALVALVSLVTKTSSLEVARKAAGDLDLELRAHGVASLAVVPLGGIASGMQIGTSRLLDNAGSVSRLSGMACAAVLAVVGLANLDLPALIPLPIAAGLVFYLGYGFLVEALSKPLAQRAWPSLLLALAIMVACVRYGYLVGVIGGIVGACLLFALSYARLGVVRQHLSRAQFAGNVVRSAEAARHLAESGEAIQLYWLAGYLFFGSSDGEFERVRRDLGALPSRRVSHVILDFAMVTGADASITVSLAKLRNFFQPQGVTLLFSSIAPGIARQLVRDGLLDGPGQPPRFSDLNSALAWCEDGLLALARLDPAAVDFQAWLQQQLDPAVGAADFMAYLIRREVEGSQLLYRAGETADDIDLVAAGRLVVDVPRDAGQPVRVRTITTHAVIGEMGFVRRAARSASVSAEGPVTLYTLRRENFERMRRERPDLAGAFYEFLLRTLADRITLTEGAMLVLGR